MVRSGQADSRLHAGAILSLVVLRNLGVLLKKLDPLESSGEGSVERDYEGTKV